jgi:hypothetical protein
VLNPAISASLLLSIIMSKYLGMTFKALSIWGHVCHSTGQLSFVLTGWYLPSSVLIQPLTRSPRCHWLLINSYLSSKPQLKCLMGPSAAP